MSRPAGCPTWPQLIERLEARAPSKAAAVKAHRNAKLPDTYITQILYHAHQEEIRKSSPTIPPQYAAFQEDYSWMTSVHEEIFKDLSKKPFEDILATHPYLKDLGILSAKAGLTVNFNFDDLVDEAAIRATEAQNKESPEIISKPKIDVRRDAPVIYHINGLLPREKARRKSDFLIFTEDAFAEVLISAGSSHSEFILSRFSNTTFLLLGTSLNDNSLKNMLRAGIKRNAANHHYIVYWEDPAALRSPEEKADIFGVNLEVYNLISIFLTTDGIAEFLALINEPNPGSFEADILQLAPTSTPKTRRKYYLVGSVASGKSSNLEALRCFTTFEEWVGRTPAIAYRDHATLTKAERVEIDNWIYGQLRKKNDKMKVTTPGIFVMDRGFLDLFAFSKDDSENLDKANALKDRVNSACGNFEDGHILFLEADKDTLSKRQASRGKLAGKSSMIDYDGAKLVVQSHTLAKIYGSKKKTRFSTGKKSCEDTARDIARLILLGSYEPFNFDNRVSEIISASGKL